ncbi:hypothetical protein GCM10027168_71330 [Streptomyces capparidis]
MTWELAPLADERVPEAAELLAHWHAKARRSLPHLSGGGFPAAADLLRARLAESGCVAAVVSRRSAVTGFLAAAPLAVAPEGPQALRVPPVAARVGLGGFAVAGGQEAEALRELYVPVAARLVARGRLAHFVDMPADDTVALAWFRLGFGLDRVRGLMPIKARGRQPREVGGLAIRRAGSGDAELIGRMAVASARCDERSAVFAPQPEAALDGLRRHRAKALAEARGAAWLAVRRGEDVGMVVLAPAEAGPVVPEGTVEVAEAFVEPAARGEGVSRVLLATALAWAYDNGYRFATAAWWTGSRLSAPHWPAVGFRPVAYRLSRLLDPRLTAAAGD